MNKLVAYGNINIPILIFQYSKK